MQKKVLDGLYQTALALDYIKLSPTTSYQVRCKMLACAEISLGLEHACTGTNNDNGMDCAHRKTLGQSTHTFPSTYAGSAVEQCTMRYRHSLAHYVRPQISHHFRI